MTALTRRLLPAACLLSLVPALALAQGGNRYTLGTRAGIFNLVGNVRVEATSGGAVEVEVTRLGSESSQLRIETGEIRDRQTLRVIYPSDRIRHPDMSRGSSSTFSVSEDGTFSWGRGGSRRVRITGGEGLDARADVVVRVPKGADVGIWLGVGEATLRNVDGNIMVDVAAASVTATGIRGRLSLDTGSGDVRVSDVDGSVTVDAGSGDVTLDNVRGDEFTVDGGSGSVTGSGLRVRRAVFDLGSGDTRLTGVTADELVVDTGSGSVDITLTSQVESMVLDTGSGDVTVRVPSTFGATLEVDTGSGDLDIELPMTITRRSRTSVNGTIGDGKARVRIDTGSGDVRILKS
jgi:hypothetical protein